MRACVAFTAAAVLICMAGAAAASPVSGTWKTPVKNALIQVYDCGADVCGRVIDSDDLRASPDMRDLHNKEAALRGRKIKGLVMMTDFKGGPSEWTGGTLYDPSSGNKYHGCLLSGRRRTAPQGGLCRTRK